MARLSLSRSRGASLSGRNRSGGRRGATGVANGDQRLPTVSTTLPFGAARRASRSSRCRRSVSPFVDRGSIALYTKNLCFCTKVDYIFYGTKFSFFCTKWRNLFFSVLNLKMLVFVLNFCLFCTN